MLLERAAPDSEVGRLRVAVHGVTPHTLSTVLAGLSPAGAAYVKACDFTAEAGRCLLVPRDDGAVACVLFGVEPADTRHRDPFLAGKLQGLLPRGQYRLVSGFDQPFLAALGFELAAYSFTRFRKPRAETATDSRPILEVPDGVDGARVALIAEAICLGRELINRPANDLGPEALEAAIRDMADRHGAQVASIRGDALLAANFPMVHAVGRAAAEPPRLVEFVWGRPEDPKVTLVGKGVCFDTGGLDIKPSASMLLMKKDMGGAAVALALAAMIMGAGLPVRLRVIVPVVENAIAGDACRPGDVLASRKGLTVEIGNTDAEGRLILADALALADEEAPDLLFDFATLTGAARVALGPDLPPFYTMADDLAETIARHGTAANDPGWRMPLWDPYDATLKSKVADINNISGGSFAGSITAALFLRRFVERTQNWAHFDVYGWTPAAKPGRPEGGEVQMAHCLFNLIAERYATGAAP
jgi:leucyl aminopeptidase